MRGVLMAGLSSVGLLVAPIAAQAADRVAAPVEDTEAFGGASSIGWILALLVAAGTIAVIVSDSDDDDEEPVSP